MNRFRLYLQNHPKLTKVLILGYIIFAGVYGIHKEKFVYIASLILTALGMISRYILEYGEVSNTMNFTLFDIYNCNHKFC